MHRKAIPEGIAPFLEGGRSRYLLEQTIDVGTDRLTSGLKDPLALPKLPHPQVKLDPGLYVPIENRDKAFGRAFRAALAWPPWPLLQHLEDHPEVVAVINETRRRDGQHLGDTRAGSPHQIQDQPAQGVGPRPVKTKTYESS